MSTFFYLISISSDSKVKKEYLEYITKPFKNADSSTNVEWVGIFAQKYSVVRGRGRGGDFSLDSGVCRIYYIRTQSIYIKLIYL